MGFAPLSVNGGTVVGSLSNASRSSVDLSNMSLLPGDKLYVCFYQNGATTWTAPAGEGWSAVGATNRTLTIFTKTWSAGDNRSPVFLFGGAGWSTTYIAWIVRSDSANSLVTDSTVSGATTGTQTFNAWTPSAEGDLRILLVEVHPSAGNTATGAINYTVSATDDNPTAIQPAVISFGFSGIAQWQNSLIWSMWRDDQGDLGTGTVNIAGSLGGWDLRSLAWTDGSAVPGYGNADLMDMFEVAVPLQALSLSSDEDQQSSGAGWWGGGANTLGDSD